MPALEKRFRKTNKVILRFSLLAARSVVLKDTSDKLESR
jgi:hypothetical protein